MKRIIAILLVFSMALSMAACLEQQPEESTEYTLAREEGHNQVTFYWNYSGDVSTADFWIWWDGKEGSGYGLYECAFGVKCVVNVPEGITQIGFIPRYDCSDPGGTSWGTATKDYEGDRFVQIKEEETVVYLKRGDATQYVSTDGGKTLTVVREISVAALTGFDTISYQLTAGMQLDTMDQVKVLEDGEEVDVTSVSSLGEESDSGIITLGKSVDLSKVYTLVIDGFDPKTVIPGAIFDTAEFIDHYTYDGDDLGAVIHGGATTFKVWAPTASRVVLNLFTAGDGAAAYASLEMTKAERGVWELTVEDTGHGVYYTYTVTTAAGTQEAVDPYAKATGVNGNRGMVIDLSRTDPAGWEQDAPVTLEQYTDAVIWEVHVRDFSNKLASSAYPGKYLAFTERGLTNSAGAAAGVDYLVQLGITHVHLQPVYDFATVDETTCDDFNWGYDPKNYNVPEGSYSTDPYHGEVRVEEFKAMVQSLHADGLGVVMDVVYNHTYDANSAFNKIVPYYYYRYNASGENTSASGCGNDTASERYMFRKFMVDSVSYWAEEYHLDGFRFDLMGLHDLQTMQLIEEAVHAINPDAIIYGEAWTMGSTYDGSAQANQSNISKITTTDGAAGGISVFNDAIRDGLKGSVFTSTSRGYISGAYESNAAAVKFGIKGGRGSAAGWQVSGAAVINYMSCHDNLTLWDKLTLSCPESTVQELVAMNKLGIAILMVSQGTPLWQAGEEMLRTKDGDENSYNSSDAINNIDWDALVPGSEEAETMAYYAGLIEMRKAYDIFRSTGSVAITFQDLEGGGMAVKYDDHMGGKALVIINPTDSALGYTLSGEWNLVANGVQAGSEILAVQSGEVTAEPVSVLIYVS